MYIFRIEHEVDRLRAERRRDRKPEDQTDIDPEASFAGRYLSIDLYNYLCVISLEIS